MGKKVVINADILGYGDDHEQDLLKQYEAVIQVGKYPGLPADSGDDRIAMFCRQNSYDLITGDAKSYRQFFEAGAASVTISRHGYWLQGRRPVYLVKFES